MFDPCGSDNWSDFQSDFGDGSNAVLDGWWYHAFAEANGTIYDPSAYTNQSGSWGDYEDTCFEKYSRITNASPVMCVWDDNQTGQSSGCEATAIYRAQTPTEAFSGPPKGF
ncbi:hypothetical protein ACFLS1_02830 [Verrucomicrobiota bacterium]